MQRLSIAVSALIGIALVVPPTVTAATPHANRADLAEVTRALQAVVDSRLAASPKNPGLIVYVGAPTHGLDWTGAAGVLDLDTRQPLTPDATFRIASNTKTFTAAATLRLVEDGKIEIDQPVAELLPAEYLQALRGDGYAPESITLRHLLTHTAALYDYAEDVTFQETVVTQPAKRWTRLEQVQFAMDHGQPLAVPGAEFHYSDTGYILLGEIIELTTGQSLADAYRNLLDFAGIGLISTYLETQEPVPPAARPRAHQYFGNLDTYDFDPSFDLYGGGGLVSSAADLGRFYRALFKGDVFHQPETLTTMMTIPVASTATGAAMGLFRYEIDGRAWWGHSGFWGSTAIFSPDRDLTLSFSGTQAVAVSDLDAGSLIANLLTVIAGTGATPTP